MDQGEQPHAGLPGQDTRLARGRVSGLGRAFGFLVREASIVHEQLRLVRRYAHDLAWRRVARDDDLSAAPGLPHHLLGADLAVRAAHGLAGLEPAEIGARRHPKTLGDPWVEAPRPLVLDQRVAVGAHSMVHPEAAHLVPVVAERLPVVELDELDVVGEPADDPAEGLEQLPQARWADDPQRAFAALEVIGLQQARHPEIVIGVVVRDVDLVHRHEPGRALHLALRAFAAIEEQPLAAHPRQQAGRGTARGGHRAARAEEDHREVHRPTVAVAGVGRRLSARRP